MNWRSHIQRNQAISENRQPMLVGLSSQQSRFSLRSWQLAGGSAVDSASPAARLPGGNLLAACIRPTISALALLFSR